MLLHSYPRSFVPRLSTGSCCRGCPRCRMFSWFYLTVARCCLPADWQTAAVMPSAGPRISEAATTHLTPLTLQTQALLFTELASAWRFWHPNLHAPTSAHVANGSLVLAYEPCSNALPDLQCRWSSGLPLGDIKRLVSQLVSATTHLHAAGLCHHGIRPGVITLHEDGVLKLGGLESARALKGGVTSTKHTASTTLCTGEGTGAFCSYTAPELILQDAGSSSRGFPADIWAIGCVCAELATGGSWVTEGREVREEAAANLCVSDSVLAE